VPLTNYFLFLSSFSFSFTRNHFTTRADKIMSTPRHRSSSAAKSPSLRPSTLNDTDANDTVDKAPSREEKETSPSRPLHRRHARQKASSSSPPSDPSDLRSPCFICTSRRSTAANPLLRGGLCRCTGSFTAVHQRCIDELVLKHGYSTCTICSQPYQIQIPFSVYRFLHLRIWDKWMKIVYVSFCGPYGVHPLVTRMVKWLWWVWFSYILVPYAVGAVYYREVLSSMELGPSFSCITTHPATFPSATHQLTTSTGMPVTVNEMRWYCLYSWVLGSAVGIYIRAVWKGWMWWKENVIPSEVQTISSHLKTRRKKKSTPTRRKKEEETRRTLSTPSPSRRTTTWMRRRRWRTRKKRSSADGNRDGMISDEEGSHGSASDGDTENGGIARAAASPLCHPLNSTSTLRELFLSECPRLSSLPSLACLTSSLHSLHLHHVAVKELEGLERMRGLEELQVESCSELTSIRCSPSSSGEVSPSPPPATSASRSPPHALQSILLHRCPQLWDISWMSSCATEGIRELKIHHCPRIGVVPRGEAEGRKTTMAPLHPAETGTHEKTTATTKEEEEEGAAAAMAKWVNALRMAVGNNPHLRLLEIVSSFTTCMTSLSAWLVPFPPPRAESAWEPAWDGACHKASERVPMRPGAEEMKAVSNDIETRSSSAVSPLPLSCFPCHQELAEIRLSGLLALTSIGGVEHLPHLTTLSIASCPRLRSYHALSRCPALVRLQLSSCPGIANLFAALLDSPLPPTASSAASGAGRPRETTSPRRPPTEETKAAEASASGVPEMSILPRLEVLELSQLPDLTSILPALPKYGKRNDRGSTHRGPPPPQEGEGRKPKEEPPFSGKHPSMEPPTSSSPSLWLHFLPCLHTLSISSCPQWEHFFSSTATPFSFPNDSSGSSLSSTARSCMSSAPPLVFPTASPFEGHTAVSFAAALQLRRVQLSDLPMLQSIHWLSAPVEEGRTLACHTERESRRTSSPSRCVPLPSCFPFSPIHFLNVSFCPSLCSLEGVQRLKELRTLTAIMCGFENLEPLRGACCLQALEEIDVSFCALLKDASALLHPPPPPPFLPTARRTSSPQRLTHQCWPGLEKGSRMPLPPVSTHHTMHGSRVDGRNENKDPNRKYNKVLKRFRASGSGLQECKEDFANRVHCPSLVELDFGESR